MRKLPKVKKTILTIALTPEVALTLEREARRRQRSRANFASWLVSEGVARAKTAPRSRKIRLEMEERASAEKLLGA